MTTLDGAEFGKQLADALKQYIDKRNTALEGRISALEDKIISLEIAQMRQTKRKK